MTGKRNEAAPLAYGLRVQHIGLHVTDMEKTMEWYTRLFGFRLLYHAPGLDGLFPKMCMFALADFCIELYEVKNPLPFSLLAYEHNIGVKHLGLAVQDFDGWLAYARSQPDAAIILEMDTPERRAVMLLDNSGIPVEVLQDPLAGEASLSREGKYGIRAQHAAIGVRDLEETSRWYHDMFGFSELPAERSVASAAGMLPGMRQLSLNGFVLELYELLNPQPFSLLDFEYSVGYKHLNIDMDDRLGWTEYVESLHAPVQVVVYCDHRNDPELPIMPHYIWDNSGMLIEMSDEHLVKQRRRI